MLELVLIWKWPIQVALFVAALIFAWRCGQAPERLCAATLNLSMIALFAMLALWPVHGHVTLFGFVNAEFLTLDLLMTAAFIAIAVKANRLYPIWLSSIQLVALTSHFSAGLKASNPPAYAVMAILPSYLQAIIVLWGTEVQRRRSGTVRAWRSDPPIGLPANDDQLPPA